VGESTHNDDAILQSSKQELLSSFSGSETGLNSEQVRKNRERFGDNELVAIKKKSIFVEILKELMAFFPLLLLISGLLSFFAHYTNPGEGYNFIGFALLFVVALNSGVSLVQKRKVEQIMSSFKSYVPEKIDVIRDGIESIITSGELVVGDVIRINEGDKIPADGIVLSQHQLKIDESILTGESVPLDKEEYEQTLDGVIFSGTTCVQGNCTMLVVATGKNTKFGQIADLTQNVKQDMTPMQEELSRFVKKISILALAIGGTFFLISMFYLNNPFWSNLVFAIGIIVANVPEGLLPTVTLALTQASQKMAKRKAVVKNLESVETLGSCNIICTDKTGTLTQNRMTVVRTFLDMQEIPVEGDWLQKFRQNPANRPFLEVLALCNNSSYIHDKHETKYVGDPTETALCEFCDRVDSTQDIRANFTETYEKTFSSKDKYMNKVVTTSVGSLYSAVKGAPEVILEKSTYIHNGGDARPMTDEDRSKLQETVKKYQSDGLRVLGLAYYTGENNHDAPENLVFIGYVALIDPPRPEVYDAVQACKTAGIRVIIVSGDNAETVKAIARQTGIALHPHAISGDVLEKMTDDELKTELHHKEIVFARTAPEQKLRIVTVLKEMGEHVAVTGDGVNDAPALRKADIGVAMGLSGTDVAKDAADIILLDDNFATIVNAIEEGRTVFDNIKRFITYVLTSNIPEIMPFLAYIIFYPHIPLALTVLQILTIDLITDILPSIGLGNERPEKDVMLRPPRKKTERLVSLRSFARSYGFIGPLESILAFTVFFVVLFAGGWDVSMQDDKGEFLFTYMYATSAFLATIIFCQIGNVMACRTNRQSSLTKLKHKNSWLNVGIAVELFVIGIIFMLPWSGLTTVMQGYYSISSEQLSGLVVEPVIPLAQWILIWCIMLLAPLVIFFMEELRKYGARKGLKMLDV